ncbi:MAG TPA: LysR substrate-binding domain-containing protein [Acidimicrobiia bacterium]|nr:LysR substrate-binding domain-containing protein [Acidimicrobiia bacterium]
MDLRRLRLFLAVVDEGGFTRAAEAEFVSQPSVSQAVRELEDELGTPLFHRVGRGVVLTAAGEALVGPARQALRDVEAARVAVAAVAGLERGRLDLCALPTLASDPVAPLTGAFRTAHPGVTVRLADAEGPAEVAALVAAGEAELGITVEHAANERLRVVALRRQDMLVVLPPGAPPRGGSRPLPVDELARYPLVATPRGTSTRALLDEAFETAGVSPNIAVVTAQREAVMPLVLAGAGATLLPGPLAEQAARLGAVVVPMRPEVSRAVVAVQRDGPSSPAAAAFLEIAGLSPPPPPAARRRATPESRR